MKRPPIPRRLRAEAMAKNNGYCMAGDCDQPGTICEHIIPFYFVQEHKLENLEPRCREHATAKTQKDQKDIGHVRRMSGKSGQYKRRKSRGGSSIQGRNTLKHPTLKRCFGGIVKERT